MRTWDAVALWLIIIGAINWLLVGLFDFNLVNAIAGGFNWFSRLIYIVVGIAGVYWAVLALSPRAVPARTA